jgi:hypothetical protein
MNKRNTNILLLICTIFIVAIFFLIDMMHNNYLSNRIEKQFNNISGSYEAFKCGCNSDKTNETILGPTSTVSVNNNINVESFISTEEEIYYKQYLYKILSANNNNQIVKLILKNSELDINLEVIFNNVLDHEKINDVDTNNAVINDLTNSEPSDYFIERNDCTYDDAIIRDNNEYKWKIINISDDLKQFELEFTKLKKDNILDTKINLVFKLKTTLQELYSDNMSFKQLIAPTNLSSISITKGTVIKENITTFSAVMIRFSDFTISRLNDFHNIMEDVIEDNILDKPYNNLRKFGRIEKDINKLENYYKFKKNIEKNYMTYKTLD